MSKNRLTIDIETTGLNFKKDQIVFIGMKADDAYISIFAEDFETKKQFREHVVERIAPYLEKGYKLSFQNGKFDLKFLWMLIGKSAFTGRGLHELRIGHDTLLMAYLLPVRPKSLALDSLASYYLGLPSWKEDLKSGEIFKDRELMEMYCLKDVEVTEELADKLLEKLKKEDRLDFYNRMIDIENMLVEAEFSGILYDRDSSAILREELEKEKESLKKELDTVASINWRSPKQVLTLFKDMGIDVTHPLTKKPSTDVEVLKQNMSEFPVAGLLYNYKKLDKKITSLVKYETEHSDDLGFINPNFNSTVTTTGRLSSSKPNLQQVDGDERIRGLFVAVPGKELVVGDMAQIEVRMAAHYSKDPNLIKVFTDKLDFYGMIATGVLKVECHPNEVAEKYPEMRKVAKVIGLSILYGCGVNRLRNTIKQSTGIEYSLKETKEIIENYFITFPGLKSLRKQVEKTLNERGYLINLLGRRVDVPYKDIYMKGVNSLLQSSASDLLMFRQLEALQKNPESKLLLLVHDEVVYQVNKGNGDKFKVDLTKIMCNNEVNGVKLRVPLDFKCEVGNNWSIKG